MSHRFNRRMRQLQKLQIQGAQAYASGAEARISFNNVQPIGKVRGGVSYAAGILLAIDVSIVKTPAGAALLNENKSYDVLARVDLELPWEDRTLIKLIEGGRGAGSAFHAWEHAANGRRGNGGGDVALTGGAATDTYRLKLFIPFGPNLMRDEFWYPIDLLRNGNLRLTWAVGAAEFGAGVDLVAGTQIREATMVIVEKNEFIVPPPFSLETYESPGLNQALPLAGRIPHAMLEVPVHAQGLVDNAVTIAERALVTLLHDGHRYTNAQSVADLAETWNACWTSARAERIPDSEVAAGVPFVPYYTPYKPDYKLTYQPMFAMEPRIEVTGTDATPRLLFWTQGVNTATRIRDAAAIAARQFSSAAFKAKGGQDVPLGGLSATRLPVVLR